MTDLEFDLGDAGGAPFPADRIRAAPPLGLDEYRTIVGALPRPTEARIAGFIEHVCEARSWHKRLPFFLPGAAFCFYLDPHKGARYRFGEDGITGAEMEPSRQPDIEALGHLVYFDGASNALDAFEFLSTETLDPAMPAILVDGYFRHLPEEVHAACRVEVTSVMEHMSGHLSTLSRIFERTPAGARSWPEASGGSAVVVALERVLASSARLTEAYTDGRIDVEEVGARSRALEAEVVAILAPERARLRAGMRAAIDALLALVR